MKALVLVVVVVGCGAHQEPQRTQGTGSGSDVASTDASGRVEARCAGFADRVAECAAEGPIKAVQSEDEKRSVRSVAYAVCTRTTQDEAALHYYGNVDAKIACMQGKSCAGVSACLAGEHPAN